MAKQPPKKPRKKRLGKAGKGHLGKAGKGHLGKAGKGHLGKAGKVVVMVGKGDVDHKAIAASNKAVGKDVDVTTVVGRVRTELPTFLDLKAKVHEGLIAANWNVYEWAQNQQGRMMALADAMDIIEEVAFTREALESLTPVQRIKLWKTFEQAMVTKVELMQVISAKAQEFSLTERFLDGYEREKGMLEGGAPMDLPYSPEFRAKVRAEYMNRVLGITQEPENPEL